MNQHTADDTRNTTATVSPVPKQSRPTKIPKSIRVRPWLLERFETVAEEQQLTFSDAIERAMEDWVLKQTGGS